MHSDEGRRSKVLAFAKAKREVLALVGEAVEGYEALTDAVPDGNHHGCPDPGIREPSLGNAVGDASSTDLRRPGRRGSVGPSRQHVASEGPALRRGCTRSIMADLHLSV